MSNYTKPLSEKDIEKLAFKIRKLLIDKKIWIDTCIYFNNKRLTTHSSKDGKFYYNKKDIIIDENVKPEDYFEYVNEDDNILSMSFEGPFYEIINNYCNDYRFRESVMKNFIKILDEFGLYYELGDSWNLTCYYKD